MELLEKICVWKLVCGSKSCFGVKSGGYEFMIQICGEPRASVCFSFGN